MTESSGNSNRSLSDVLGTSSDAVDEGPHMTASTAAALMIGGELLSGKIRDENLHRLSVTLRALGIQLRRATFVPDERDVIAREVQQLATTHDVLFTSGGVGPTHDDVTVEAVAQGLGLPVSEDQQLVSLLSRVYGEQMSDTHRLMARVPEGSRLVETKHVRWPTIVARNVWILPGVPQLFHMKLSAIRDHLRGPEPFFTESVLTRREEVTLKDSLDRVVAAHPRVEVGSYPKWFDERYKTRVTFDARTKEEARAARDEFVTLLGDEVVPDLDSSSENG